MFGRLGDLIGDGRAAGAVKEHLLRLLVNHVEEGLQSDPGLTLQRKQNAL